MKNKTMVSIAAGIATALPEACVDGDGRGEPGEPTAAARARDGVLTPTGAPVFTPSPSPTAAVLAATATFAPSYTPTATPTPTFTPTVMPSSTPTVTPTPTFTPTPTITPTRGPPAFDYVKVEMGEDAPAEARDAIIDAIRALHDYAVSAGLRRIEGPFEIYAYDDVDAVSDAYDRVAGEERRREREDWMRDFAERVELPARSLRDIWEGSGLVVEGSRLFWRVSYDDWRMPCLAS